MVAKHTPGPWTIQWGRNGNEYPIAIHNGTANVVNAISRPAQDEATANAHLIAAAPEMYETLQKMVADEAFEDLCQGIGEIPSWLTMARAAIAKAEGR